KMLRAASAACHSEITNYDHRADRTSRVYKGCGAVSRTSECARANDSMRSRGGEWTVEPAAATAGARWRQDRQSHRHQPNGRLGRHAGWASERAHVPALAEIRAQRREADLGWRSGGRDSRGTRESKSTGDRTDDAWRSGEVASSAN